MPKTALPFKVSTVRRAIRTAHAQGLIVDSYDIKSDGSIHIELRDYQIAADGTVRIQEDAAA